MVEFYRVYGASVSNSVQLICFAVLKLFVIANFNSTRSLRKQTTQCKRQKVGARFQLQHEVVQAERFQVAETWQCCERVCMTHSQSRGIGNWTSECV